MEENTNGQHLKDTETGFLGVASTVTKKDGTGKGQRLGACFCLPRYYYYLPGVLSEESSPEPNENGNHQQEQPAHKPKVRSRCKPAWWHKLVIPILGRLRR